MGWALSSSSEDETSKDAETDAGTDASPETGQWVESNPLTEGSPLLVGFRPLVFQVQCHDTLLYLKIVFALSVGTLRTASPMRAAPLIFSVTALTSSAS